MQLNPWSVGQTVTNDERRAAIRRRYSVALMNDTRWREVWTCMARYRIKFCMAFALGEQWNSANSHKLQFPIREELVDQSMLRDPGVGGPVPYFEILWVRIPRAQNSNYDAAVQSLMRLGQLPIQASADGLVICAYAAAE